MKRFLLVILFLGAMHAKAQTTGEEKLGSWLMYFGTNKLSEKYSLHTEAQLRLFEPLGNFNQLLLRVGLNYHINKQSLVTFGYGYIPTATFDQEQFQASSIEHRLWEQLILTNILGRFFFEHRYRVEQRWISAAIDDLYLNRLRYRLLVNIPINHATLTDNTFFLSFYDEIFLNVTETPFDQNRLYAALGYKLSNALNVQTGYLRHRLGNNNFDRLQLAIFFNTDFSRPAQ